MRIAIVTTSYPNHDGDPAGHFVHAEAHRLAGAGHRVTVIAPGAERHTQDNPRVVRLGGGSAFGWPGLLHRVRKQPLRLLSMSTFLFSAARYLRHVEVDRVVAHWVVPCGWPLGLCNRAPLEVVAHGSDVRLLQGLPRAVRSAIVGTLLRRNTRFRFVAASLREELVASTSERLRERSNVAPSPFDIPPNLNRKLARTLLDVPESERLLVMVGRLIPGKRFDVALSAATLLPKARVVMVGDGPERVALASRFPAALFTGMLPRKQALRWIAAADVLIATSLEEGAPTVVREARALGVDVVAVDSADLALWADTDPGIHLVKSPAQGRR